MAVEHHYLPDSEKNALGLGCRIFVIILGIIVLVTMVILIYSKLG